MRRIVQFVLSGLLGIAMWSGGEALAYAAPTTGVVSRSAPGPLCQPAMARQAMAGINVGLSLAQAKSCWPHAMESPSGEMATPGEYLIRHGRGWIHAGWSITASDASGMTPGGHKAIAASCGQQVNWTVQSWEAWLDLVTFTTGEVVSTCRSAWSVWQTPACSGLGKCVLPVFGVLGQRSPQVNPWYNQTVDYFALTEFFYCRHYVSDLSAISAYCG